MKTIFYDVDTQIDFMYETGALYVPGAKEIRPNLAALTRYAKEHRIQVVSSVDAHDADSKEFISNGGPFPYHCMKGSAGQRKISQTRRFGALVVPNEVIDLNGILDMDVVIEKDAYDVATNPNFDEIIRATKASRAIVYGVATDYCVKAASLALRRLGLETIVVKDAISAVDNGSELAAFKEMDDAGVKYTTTGAVLEGKI